MPDDLKVYLDHLIFRESLRYRRPDEAFKDQLAQTRHPTIRLSDFLRDEDYIATLRKPDFQRATWAWSPEDCLSLLDTLINYQVIPSIIMWRSPETGLRYILDGGHRVSVVLAWLNDDWGESQAEFMDNSQQADMVLKAARQVRNLVDSYIGNIRDYELAAQEIMRLTIASRSPKVEMEGMQNGKAFERGIFYQTLRAGDIFFSVLWANGDYRIAEQSFLKINKSGRQLSDWETKLIENRNSSFARLVMSLTNVRSAPYYWPDQPEELVSPELRDMVGDVLNGIRYMERILFYPEYRRPLSTLEQPFLAAPADKKPYWIAELLTVIQGYRGQTAETEQLLAADKDANPSEIVANGHKLIIDTINVFDHVVGNPDPSDPANKSLEVVPLLYFYKPDGSYIRSLLYGFLYWLIQGGDEEITARKEIFSVYRGPFERVFKADKDILVQGLGRNIGSGSEVTLQTAIYYNTLLDLLVKYAGDIDSEGFLADYGAFIGNLAKTAKQTATPQAVRSRIFTPRQKSTTIIDALLNGLYTCQICGGKLNPSAKVQHDHIQRSRDGGATITTNERILHPFCNQKRDQIELLKQQTANIRIPKFDFIQDPQAPRQLALFDDAAFLD